VCVCVCEGVWLSHVKAHRWRDMPWDTII
jgi:hypothetical protein